MQIVNHNFKISIINIYVPPRSAPGPSMKRVDDAVTKLLIPERTGGITPTPLERRLFSLPPSLAGLGIPIFEESSAIKFGNSKLLTEMLQDAIIDQKCSYEMNKKI